jgi:hypothetical protein
VCFSHGCLKSGNPGWERLFIKQIHNLIPESSLITFARP